jgi:hypothetical protein
LVEEQADNNKKLQKEDEDQGGNVSMEKLGSDKLGHSMGETHWVLFCELSSCIAAYPRAVFD